MDTQTASVIVGATAAVVAAWGIYSSRIVTRRKTTIEYIYNLLNDHDYIAAKLAFNILAKADDKMLEYVPKGEPEGLSEERTGGNPSQLDDWYATKSAIVLILNNYELIAIGIQRGVLDYKIVERYMRAIVTAHWEASRTYIEKLRTDRGNDNLFSEFKTLNGWMKGDVEKPKSRFWALWF